MRADELDIVLKRRPFTPFRMVLVNGEAFVVKHPDQLILGDHFAAFGVREARGPNDEGLFIYWIDLTHITYVCRLQGIEL